MPKGRYDVIVVGAGTAGLFCANFLARYGKKTLLLEHNHQPGGLTGGFWRRNYYFDAGDQSFESGGAIFPLLKKLKLYRAEDWERTDFTTAYEHGSVEMRDQQQAMNELAALFPEHRENMQRVFAQMARYAELIGAMFDDRTTPLLKSGPARLRALLNVGRLLLTRRQDLQEMISTTLPEFYNRYLPPSELRDKMSALGYRNMPVALASAFWFTWFEDYWYYKRGLQAWINELTQSFTKHGGVLHTNSTVDQILIEKDRASGVRTTDGNYYTAGRIVFAGSVKRLYTELIDPYYLDSSFVYKIKTAAVSEPLISLYLGVDMSTAELMRKLKTHHTLFFPEGPPQNCDDLNNDKMHESVFTEINWPSMRSPWLAPQGKNSLVLQSFSSYNWKNNWGTGSDDSLRNDQYNRLKEMVSDQMVDTLERYVPGIKSRIEYRELGSPLSTISYTLNPEGASAGWTYELDRTVLKGKWLSLISPIPRLYTIGHYSVWPGGVPMAAMTGYWAARLIKNEYKADLVTSVSRLGKKRGAW